MRETDYARLRLLVLDVDGVLTDGRVVLTPAGEEIKAFHVRDGAGMKYWRRVGGKLAIISGRSSPAVRLRAEELGVDAVRLGAKVKLPVCREVIAQLGVSPRETAVMGDDLTDLPLFGHCGFSAAPADAVEEVRSAADYVARRPGGEGCVREVIELILKEAGTWAQVMARYLPAAEDQP